jgi:hypothetical protein
VTIVPGWDAAFYPASLPPGDWCEAYIGGSSALRRSGQSCAELLRAARIPKLPVWVPTPGVDNPRQSALACVGALKAFGVPAYATPWRAVLWDLETGTEPDPAWFAAAHAVVMAHGYDTMSYGSVAWAFGEPNYAGMVIARYDGQPELATLQAAHPGAAIVGKQYRAGVSVPGGTIDLDVIEAAVMPHLGLWRP